LPGGRRCEFILRASRFTRLLSLFCSRRCSFVFGVLGGLGLVDSMASSHCHGFCMGNVGGQGATKKNATSKLFARKLLLHKQTFVWLTEFISFFVAVVTGSRPRPLEPFVWVPV
jgi:hypothetical protein